jgi:ribosomal protein S18 acetylase RimI-like enzyme
VASAGASTLAATIRLRAAGDSDRAFLFQVYASTRSDELVHAGWSVDQLYAFLSMQFDVQHRYYHENFPSARFDVIELDGKPAGRLYVERQAEEIRVVDISLLPEYRGRGYGGTLMRALLSEAGAARKRVVLHVEQHNRAAHLYQRLGFVTVPDTGVYNLMVWSAG